MTQYRPIWVVFNESKLSGMGFYKQPYYMLLKRISWVFALLLAAQSVALAAPTKEEGKTLFGANCASCHNRNMKDKMTGPALGDVEKRWSSKKNLYAWIRNSQAYLNTGDPYATALYNEYGKSQMNAFPNLTDDQVASLLLYIDDVYKNGSGGPKPADGAGGGVGANEDSGSNMWLFAGLALLLALLAFALMRIVDHLANVSRQKDGEAPIERSWVNSLTSKGFIAFLVFASVLIGGYKTVDNATRLGRTQNYEPDQPIKFSHKTHAGVNKIECQYCHDSARRSKHSSIPGTNTCMNCHSAVKVGSQYGTAEISKIYASIGYNPLTNKLEEGYENWSEQQVEDLYKKWIGEQYVATHNAANPSNKIVKYDEREEGVTLVKNQWQGIVNALKNDSDGKIQGPIQWTRIHNLPDHAYFNHAQHVSVGGVACQKCHGPVEEMEDMYQYSTLGMGWCISCHRETEVKVGENGFYKNYDKAYIERHKLSVGKSKEDAAKVVVEDIGGLECQKCHY
jgi:mono/diheme cytochrome c family protein